MHDHDSGHLVVVLAGGFVERSEKNERHCVASTVLFRPPGEKHENVIGADGTTYVRMAVPFTSDSPLPASTIGGQYAEVRRLAKSLHTSSGEASALLQNILRSTLREWRIRRARALITEKASNNLRLDAVAREVGLEPANLTRGFRTIYGRTPTDVRLGEQVAAACEALRLRPDLSLAEVALLSGFYDQSHMTRVFRRYLGTTPGRCCSR